MERRSDDMRKSIFEDARLRELELESVENEDDSSNGNVTPARGRTLRSTTVMNFRPSNIEKNIVRDSSSRVRNTSEPSLGSNRNRSTDTNSDTSSLNSTQNNGQVRPHYNYKNHDPVRQSNGNIRYRNPMSTYLNEHAVDSIVPNHNTMLHQKYHKSMDLSSNRSSKTNTTIRSKEYGSKSSQRTSISVSMNNEMIPAFNDLKMDFDKDDDERTLKSDDEEDDLVDDRTSYLSEMSNEHDNKFTESLELLKELQHQRAEGNRASLAHSSKSSTQVKATIGRIQQKMNNLKMLGNEEKPVYNVFSSIEQKVLIESLKKELINLRRYNCKPMLEAVQRVRDKYEDISQPKRTTGPQNFMINKEILITQFNGIESDKRKEVNIKRLSTLIKTSTAIMNELWEEPVELSSSYKPTILPSTSTESMLPETRFLKEQLEGFKLGTGSENLSISFEQSPKTSRV